MKHKYFCPAIPMMLITWICAVMANAQGLNVSSSKNAQDIQAKIIQSVQENVDFMKEHVVDLLSIEEVTIEEFDVKGKLTKTTDITSEYRVFSEAIKNSSDCSFAYEALESTMPAGILRDERVILSAKENNKTQRAERFNFNEPVWSKGHNHAGYLVFFDKLYENCFYYSLNGVEKIDGRDAYGIEVMKREEEVGESKGMSWKLAYLTTAWIDAETMDVVQLNRNNLAVTYTYAISTADLQKFRSMPDIRKVISYTVNAQYKYGKVKINDQLLTLPTEKTIRFIRENGQLETAYKYRYNDYKAFNVATKILFGASE